MKFFASRSVKTTFNIITAMLLVALFLALAYFNYRREQELIIKAAVDKARIISNQIIETRNYISQSVTTEPERNYSLIPQDAATRIAQRLTSGSNFYVRQVSLRYRNPGNRPDPVGTTQLTFCRYVKVQETWQVANEKGKKALRYLYPMKADKSCLICH